MSRIKDNRIVWTGCGIIARLKIMEKESKKILEKESKKILEEGRKRILEEGRKRRNDYE